MLPLTKCTTVEATKLYTKKYLSSETQYSETEVWEAHGKIKIKNLNNLRHH